MIKDLIKNIELQKCPQIAKMSLLYPYKWKLAICDNRSQQQNERMWSIARRYKIQGPGSLA